MRIRKWGSPFRLRSWALFIVLVLALCITMSVAVTPQNYSLKAGDVAPENILAAREVVDQEATSTQKQQARDAVAQVYSIDNSGSSEVVTHFSEFASSVEKVRTEAKKLLQPYLDDYTAQGSKGKAPTYDSTLRNDQWQTLLSLCPVQTDKTTLNGWLLIADTDYQKSLSIAKNILSERLAEGITEARVNPALQSVYERIDTSEIALQSRPLFKLMMERSLKANAFYDGTATELARQKAEDAVVDITYKKGQIVVRIGEVVTQRQIEMLENMGMLAGGIVWSVYIGVFLSALLAVGTLIFYLHGAGLAADFKKTLMICIVLYLVVLLGAFLQRINLQIVPIAFVAIVLSLTMNISCGTVVGMITAFLCASTALAAGIEGLTVFAFLTSGWMGCYPAAVLINRHPTRNNIVAIGIVAGAVGSVIQLVLGLLTHTGIRQIVYVMAMQLSGGILSGIVCLGTTPVWENVFNALTPMKLMELCNPTNPLLKRLMFEAPGTYHHSVMVGNLAEAAAEAIGANGLLARVGAYYHDVGKLSDPQFFIENQPAGMKNPHDEMQPLESARLIMRHPHDSAILLKEQGIAQPIIDIALQHHGSSTVGFFYSKAKEQDSNADIRDFRHTGGKPNTAEAAIVMLADCCEAATRASGGEYDEMMRKIFLNRLEDGQLDKAPLTFAQLDTIRESFLSVLRGAYHGRIQYQDNTDEKAVRDGEKADEQGNSNH